MTFRVLVADQLSSEGLHILRSTPGIELLDKTGISKADLMKALPGVHALVIRSRTTADADVIAAGTDLKIIGRAGIGVDNIDVRAATRAGVVVMNTPEGNATTTAEHSIALMMSMARMIPQATASMKRGEWEKKKFMGRELCDKTLGLVGLGNIGRIVADRAIGLKMHVVAFDPYFDPDAAAKLGVELASLADVLKRADVISVHTPLTDETRNLISDKQIETMKQGVMLINCARGGIYDEQALRRGLDAGKIGAVALDVFVEEPPQKDHVLLNHERVICTPHLGASTEEAQAKVAVDIARQISEFAAGGPARNAVNMPRIALGELKVLGPYIDLAERLGSFSAQVMEGSLQRIEVDIGGDIAGRPSEPVVTAVIAGVLRHAFARPVTPVNARIIAEERGIQIVEKRAGQAKAPLVSHVGVMVETREGKRHQVLGTIFGANQARLMEVDGIHLEAVPEGELLLITNRDKPGVIGHIGTVLGAAKINVARMHLGLDKPSETAMSLVSTGVRVPVEVLKQLHAGDVTGVRAISL